MKQLREQLWQYAIITEYHCHHITLGHFANSSISKLRIASAESALFNFINMHRLILYKTEVI